MSIIQISPPRVTNFRDGNFTGANGSGGTTAPGSLRDFPPTTSFWLIPPITPRSTTQANAHTPINKRIIYVNGIQTFSQAHANTVKLISVITGANVCGVYNMSGNGRETLISEEVQTALDRVSPQAGLGARILNLSHKINGFITDIGQCIDDKLLQVHKNPATLTLGSAILDACINNVPINIVAHSQGAIITSGAVRIAIVALIFRYAAEENSRRGFNILHTIGDALTFGTVSRVERFQLLQRADRRVREKLRQIVSIQTFGGAATWYPDGPRYRHVYNTAGVFSGDPIPKLAGQGNIFAHPGRGATVERLNRGGRGVSANHSIDENYLQTSQAYTGSGQIIHNSTYNPIHLDMLR